MKDQTGQTKEVKLDQQQRDALFGAIGWACEIEEGFKGKPRLVIDPERFVRELEKIGYRFTLERLP